MDTRLSRDKVQVIGEDLAALRAMGFVIEPDAGWLRLTYPESAVRETISEREGRYIVFFTHNYERRQMSEVYNPSSGTYILTLKPARFHN